MQARILKTGTGAEDFDAVFDAARAAGLRVGWLELRTTVEAPATLEDASSAGALRAVAVGSGAVVSVKRLKGPPVLKDLLREHFTGCRLVLVSGTVEAPEISPAGDSWLIRWEEGVQRKLSTDELIGDLEKPGFP